MNPTFLETLELDDGTPITVKFAQGRYYPAILSGPADNWAPAEGGEIEILDVFGDDGKSVAITDTERQRLYDELYRMPPHEPERDPDREREQRRDEREWASQGEDW